MFEAAKAPHTRAPHPKPITAPKGPTPMISKALTYLLCAILGVTTLCVGGLLGLTGAALACSPSNETSTTASEAPTKVGVRGAVTAPTVRCSSGPRAG